MLNLRNLLLIALLSIFAFSCKKNIEIKTTEQSSFNAYNGNDEALKILSNKLLRLDSSTHFISDFPENCKIDWDSLKYSFGLGDTTYKIVFPILSADKKLNNVLIAKVGKDEQLRNASILSRNEQRKEHLTDSIFNKNVFGLFEHKKDHIGTQSFKPTIKKINTGKIAATADEPTCTQYYYSTINVTFYPNSSCPSASMLFNSLNYYLLNYVNTQLRLNFPTGFHADFDYGGAGTLAITGPVSAMDYSIGNAIISYVNQGLQEIFYFGPAVVPGSPGCVLASGNVEQMVLLSSTCGTTPPDNPSQPPITQKYTFTSDEDEANYTDLDNITAVTRLPIKYTYIATATKDSQTGEILSIVIDPITADPMVGQYTDRYGRIVTRSLTLLNQYTSYQLTNGGLNAVCTWDVLVNAQYVYSDGSRASRQWTVVKTGNL